MAGHNTCNVLRGYVEKQERLDYLQPVDEHGTFPWKEQDNNNSKADTADRSEQPSSRKDQESSKTKPKTAVLAKKASSRERKVEGSSEMEKNRKRRKGESEL